MSIGANTESVDEQAARWAARVDAAPGEPHPELEQWLRANPRHAGALLRAQATLALFHADLPDAAALPEIAAPPQIAAAPAAPSPARRSPRRERRWWLAGGGIGLAAVAGAAALLLTGGEETYATGLGEVRALALQDGSAVSIDARSRIDVALDDHGRHVELKRGKVLFRVAHDPQRPFRVTVGGVTITDVGTVFQVTDDAASGTVEVLVAEGAVEVATATGTTRLVGGQRGLFTRSDAHQVVETVTAARTERALGWTSGQLELDGETLGSAIAEMNLHNRLQIALADPALAGEPLYGAFRLNDPINFAQAAAISIGGSSQVGADRIVIAARENPQAR